jgi:magnesium-transporting ATPase (P-type)
MITAVYDSQAKGLFVYVKGASEIVLSQCTKILENDGKARPLDQTE